MRRARKKKKIVVLGIDAMDPGVCESLMRQDRLPWCSRLSRIAYAPLKTVMPPESAVAWTSFATGVYPGGHGIFDFVMRDAGSYMPYLSLHEITTGSRPKAKTRRTGEAFWNVLTRNGIPSYIYFCPNTFPPERIAGSMISGMGVPDLYGTMGRFLFYTTRNVPSGNEKSRGRIVPVQIHGDAIETRVFGPRAARYNAPAEESAIPLRCVIREREKGIAVTLQGKEFFIGEKSWSEWKEVSFPLYGFKKAHGIIRLYLQSLRPYFELYCSPVNFHPQKPLFPISFPRDFSGKLSEETGFYYTQGMPFDTWSLNEGLLDEKAFREMGRHIFFERANILRHELKKFTEGVFFFYFDYLDMMQHMFWHQDDKSVISGCYEDMDGLIGEVMKSIDEDTLFMAVSDHGFNAYRKNVHLNRWLLETGYLVLRKGAQESPGLFEHVDWQRTRAYALGFGGIYLNKAGREREGVVRESEAEGISRLIVSGLEAWRDPAGGQRIIRHVYTREELCGGPCSGDGPDLFTGFELGYRASWQTALGGIPSVLLEDNTRKWSGDHLFDASLVPGVLFMNKKITVQDPVLVDIAPSVLSYFGITPPASMPGRNITAPAGTRE